MDQGTDNAPSTKTKGRSILQELQKSKALLLVQFRTNNRLGPKKSRALVRDLIAVQVSERFLLL
jgi:hypothetical protein